MDYVQEASDSPKHLRVGVNSAMVDHAALVNLLVDKGIITVEDYWHSIVEQMQAEVTRYEQLISSKLGRSIKLK